MPGATAEKFELPLEDIPSVWALPPGSFIPVAPNPNFTGRDEALRSLARILQGGPASAEPNSDVVGIVSTISGLGGVGKTQLAAEFSHRYGRFFPGGVQWINMTDVNSVESQVASCGMWMDLPQNFAELTQQNQAKIVQRVWAEPTPRLLIFDNCEDDQLLAHWRPKTGGSRLLVTSRQGNWNPGMGIQPLPLKTLSRPASVALLQKFAPWLPVADAFEIAGVLGDLPLALHMAGSYLNVYAGAISSAEYLKELRQAGVYHISLTAEEGAYIPTDHDLHIGRSIELSYEKIGGGDTLAQNILARLACLAPGKPVPSDLYLVLIRAGENPPTNHEVSAALRRLHRLGLVEIVEEAINYPIAYLTASISLHRLIVSFLSRQMDLTKIRTEVELIVATAAERINQAGVPTQLNQWVEHLRFVAENAGERDSEVTGLLFNQLGWHLDDNADYAGAKFAYQKALYNDETIFGTTHPRVANGLNNLGLVLLKMEDLKGAQQAFERALSIGEDTLPTDNPILATRVNNLGLVLKELGDLEGARNAYERALSIWEENPNVDINQVAIGVNNLGNVLQVQGDIVGAQAAFERALQIFEKSENVLNPNAAKVYIGLGRVLRAKGDLAGARNAFEQGLKIDEAVHGKEHPEVATDSENLGYLLEENGENGEAIAAFQRALRIREKFLGQDHSETQSVHWKLVSMQKES